MLDIDITNKKEHDDDDDDGGGWKGIPQFWAQIENALSPYVAVLLLGITRRF